MICDYDDGMLFTPPKIPEEGNAACKSPQIIHNANVVLAEIGHASESPFVLENY